MEKSSNGWIAGFIGVAMFAGSLPATRVAVIDFGPAFLTGARAAIAALLSLALLCVMRERKPHRHELPSLTLAALGGVVGFPLLTALALQHMTSATSIVFMGMVPFCTAVFGVLRGGERPAPLFWVFSLAGATFVVGYAALGGIESSPLGILYMLAAVIVCGLGYAEGAILSRTMGGWQVITWSLVISLPLMLPITLLTVPASFGDVSVTAWVGLAYVSLFSMFLGYVFWYHGLAKGGIAAVGQLQLFQPFMGFALAALLLDETVSWTMVAITAAAIVCVAGARRHAA